MECDPLPRPRTSDHQLCLIHPSSQMDQMHHRNSQNSLSLLPLQHILQPQVIFLTTKAYIIYFQQSVIFVSLHLFNDTLSNSRLYNVIWQNDCELVKVPRRKQMRSEPRNMAKATVEDHTTLYLQ